MIGLLNKIQQWTQDGPTATNLYQPWGDDWDVNELVSQETQWQLLEETGYFPGGEEGGWDSEEDFADWQADYGSFITPYDDTQEQFIGQNFLDDMNKKFSETYLQLGEASKFSGRTGFGTSYAGSGITESILQNAGAAMSSARTKKDALIYGAREDWVSELYDTFEYLGTMGAFDW